MEALDILLPKLSELLTEEYNLHKKLRGEIMFLKAELESMEAALIKVSEKPIDQQPDPQDKIWVRDVRDLSYDIEDSIDKFMIHVDPRAPNKLHSFRGFIDRSLKLLNRAKFRHKIGTDIEEIKGRIKEVTERRYRYKVDGVAAKPVYPTIDILRLSALNKRAEEFVDIDEKRDEVVRRLMEGDEMSKKQLRIVSIVGFGGLGKTALAYVVYEKLKIQFDCVAFVSVSLNPNMIKIFKDMFDQLDKEKNTDISKQATWDETLLIIKLREFLRDKRYLVVIDDIWDTPAWETIKYSLSDNENGSRIITTTRIFDVAEEVGGIYQMAPLSVEHSRKLFCLRIFGAEERCPNQLAEVSEKILRKCAGVPLAIITIASVLASKSKVGNEHTYWSKVYQSMGSGLEDNLHVKNMRRILSVSYYDLPPNLRTCLLYLCLYPEDYYIPREDLIRLWVYEGFVHREQGKNMYQVGEDYFNELVRKFRVHDMVHDLITSLSNEECFVTTVCGQHVSPIRCKVRRLSLQTSYEDSLKQLETMSLSHVRSLIVLKRFKLVPAPLSKIFPVLRVLNLAYCEQVKNQHVKDICHLFHLRFLDLWGTSITELPREIKNLRFLQTLKMGETGIEELPSTFVQLEQLEYFVFRSKMRLPNGFGNLKCLQELGGDIIIDSPTMLDDLGRLTELRRLSIDFNDRWNKSYEEAFLRCLAKLTSLCQLAITGNLSLGSKELLSSDMHNSDIYSPVPNWKSSISSLSTLNAQLKTLGEGVLELLGSLPSLRYLSIEVDEPTLDRDERLTIGTIYPFMCLTWFRLSSATMEVAFAKGAMPKLHALRLIFEVQKTKELFGGDMDFGLENLSSLQLASICLSNCSCATPEEIEVVEDALRKAVTMNPNNPSFELQRSDDDDNRGGGSGGCDDDNDDDALE
uniref:NB-ARC domain-containing protein n=1 Tax=Leersia perrieri TaxID=77586 RepID=A0A0D9XT06_9ORYZ